jgi:hypothetical protein
VLQGTVDGLTARLVQLSVTVGALVRPLDSVIPFEFPVILAQFRGKPSTLLWRGSRDGFQARDVHAHCDGHAEQHIRWLHAREVGARAWNRRYDAENNTYQADPARKSFLFTLRNPHKYPSRRFRLNATDAHRAIICNDGCGPFFQASNTTPRSYTRKVGMTYENETGLGGGTKENTFFTGAPHFTVAEVEDFHWKSLRSASKCVAVDILAIPNVW